MSYLPFARASIDEETIVGVCQVLRSGWITSGPYVTKFEVALSTYLSNRPVRAVSSGTAALELALRAANVGAGDEVIVPAMSFAASANVILRVGATPVFVDVELASRNLDLELTEAAITPRTRAIMPVHFAGKPVNMDRLLDLANSRGVRVIEDAAHAIGSAWRGRRIGSFGDIACFSFHPNKNITTIEGGAVVLDSPDENHYLELARFHGIERDADNNVDVTLAGGKYNLSDVSARIGLGQLSQLDAFCERRRALAEIYLDELSIDPPGLLPERGDAGHCWNMFTLLLPFAALDLTRPQFLQAMAKRGVGIGVHYPCIPGLTVYKQLGYSEDAFPNAARIGRETVTLPLFPQMSDDDVRRVCHDLRGVLAERT